MSLDPSDIPIEANIEELEKTIVPGYRAGVPVAFESRKNTSCRVTIWRGDGEFVTNGVRIIRVSDGKIFWGAFDGEGYLEFPSADAMEFQVLDKDGACFFTLAPAGAGEEDPVAVTWSVRQ